MLRSLIIALMALTITSQMVRADEPGDDQQRRQGMQQGNDFRMPYAQNQMWGNNGGMIQNQSYQFGGGYNTYLMAGRGLPMGFRCVACFIRQIGWNFAEVIAQDPYLGYYRIWAGPNGRILIAAVNAIKVQTGMCGNLPFVPVPPPMPIRPLVGPQVLPVNPPGPMPGPVYNPAPPTGGNVARPPGT